MPVEELAVRLCTEADLPALHAREVHPSARVAQRHFDRQQAGDYLYAVVLADDQVLGTCALDCDPAEPLRPELKSLWVYPEARRRGAGRALTRFLEQRAADLGFVVVFLRVDPDNAAAIPMYIGLDYSPTGDHVVTTYESVDDQGAPVSTEQTDAVYRKSLLTR